MRSSFTQKPLKLGKLYALEPFKASDTDLAKLRNLKKDFTSFVPLYTVCYNSLALWDEVVKDSGKNRRGDLVPGEPFMILEIVKDNPFYRIIQTINGESKIGYIKFCSPGNYDGCLHGDVE